MKKIALLMLVFTLFAGTNVYAQKLKNGTYEGSSRYGGVYVRVSVSGRKIKEISVYGYRGDDQWMKDLIDGNGIEIEHGSYYYQGYPMSPKQEQEYKENSFLLKKEGPHYTSVQEFADAIVKNQSTVIDVMSGATQTCESVIEAVHNALRSKNGDIVRAWEQEGTQKRLATAQRRNTLKEEERQRVAKAEAEKKRQEEEAKQKAEDDRQKRIAEALVQEPVTPAASEFKYDVASDGGVKIIKYLGNAMSIRIPEKLEGLPVTEISDGAFDKNTLVKIVIHGTVKKMSFGGSIGLREVSLEEGIKYISGSAFEDCRNLKSIKLPIGLQMIEKSAFENSGLESIDIPDSVARIGDAAFRGCKNLKSAKLPAELTQLGDDGGYNGGIFANSGLESIIIPDSVTYITAFAFSGCGNLESVTLPKNLRRIGYSAFEYCHSLSEIIIPDTLNSVYCEHGAFRGCSRLSLATKSKLRGLGYAGDDFNEGRIL